MAINAWTATTDQVWGATPGGASLNWSLGTVPEYTDDVTVTDTPGGDITLDDWVHALSLNFTGYSGELKGATAPLAVHGDLTMSAEMTQENGKFRLNAGETSTILSNGQYFTDVQVAETMTLGDDMVVKGKFLAGGFGSHPVMHQGVNSLTVERTTEAVTNFDVSMSTLDWDYSAGADVTLKSDVAEQTFILAGRVGADMVPTLPPLKIEGAQNISMAGRIKSETLDLTEYSGTISHSDDDCKFVTTGDMDLGSDVQFGSGSLARIKLTCGGNFTADCNLDASGFMAPAAQIAVTGTAVLTGGAERTVTNCNFTGSRLQAYGCTDGGGNTGVDFAAPGPTESEKNAKAWWIDGTTPGNSGNDKSNKHKNK